MLECFVCARARACVCVCVCLCVCVCEGEWLEARHYQRLYAHHARLLCYIVNIFFGLAS
jgi:hypothetical protein